jgi:MoxR-like ATPase
VAYAARLVRATRPSTPEAAPTAQASLQWGAGPRAGQALLLAAKAKALLQGRFSITPTDVQAVWLPVLRHRVLPTFAAEAEGHTADVLLGRILAEVKLPGR